MHTLQPECECTYMHLKVKVKKLNHIIIYHTPIPKVGGTQMPIYL